MAKDREPNPDERKPEQPEDLPSKKTEQPEPREDVIEVPGDGGATEKK
jgi:hypothetical protein